MPKAKELTYTQQFQQAFKSLCYSRSNWKVWGDFITMSACTISNAADKAMFEQREEMYMRTIQDYSKDELVCMAELFAITVMALEENQKQDFLGGIYIELGLLNKQLCQVFTPYHLAQVMAEMAFENISLQIAEKGFASVSDPTCGSGVMLIAAANVAREKGINYQRSMVFVGQDIDFTVAMMAYIQLTLLGCAGYVGVGNTLTEPLPSRENIWHIPMNRIHRKLWEDFYHSN